MEKQRCISSALLCCAYRLCSVLCCPPPCLYPDVLVK
ncbi:hypothetical protein E2C01_065723 [Portunus trituberculatus]|uniref:Uncharacterized protein n=1 Tax=Portunus trituberculatus TaxID=210409 RepID=A0A5B7HNC3_PORTR|nr:hypothetical protein [Portunus trituberculatus]